MNQELSDYIKKAKASGKSNEQIKSDLLWAGWKSDEVNPSSESIDDKVIRYSFWVTIPIFLYFLLGLLINFYVSDTILFIAYSILFLFFYLNLLTKNEFHKYSKLFFLFSVLFTEIYFLAYYFGLFNYYKNYYDLTPSTLMLRGGETLLMGALVLFFSLGVGWLFEKVVCFFLSDENKITISQLPNPKLSFNLVLRKEALFVLVGAVVIFFVIYINYPKIAGLELQQQAIQNEIHSPTSINQESPLSKIYTNTKYDYQISYDPKIYTINAFGPEPKEDPNADNILFFKTADLNSPKPLSVMAINVFPNLQELSSKDYLRQRDQQWRGDPSYFNEPITFNGLGARKFGTERDRNILVAKGKFIFIISDREPELRNNFKFTQ